VFDEIREKLSLRHNTMGCDIHLHEEVKIEGEWHHYGAPSMPRHYDLFGKMAGVRGEEDPIVEPRGMPEDATLLTRMDFERYGSSKHDASWLGPEEIAKLYDWMHENVVTEEFEFPEHRYFDYCFGSTFAGFHEYGTRGTSIPEAVENVRFVFFFDN